LRLAAWRRPVPLARRDLAVVSARFDSRAPDSPWQGFGSVGDTETWRLVLFTAWRDRPPLTVTRFDDGSFELAASGGRVLRRERSIAPLLAALS
jgi:hypothetical protein